MTKQQITDIVETAYIQAGFGKCYAERYARENLSYFDSEEDEEDRGGFRLHQEID